MKHPPILRLLATLLLALTATTATAYDFEVNGIYYDKNSDGTSVSVTYKDTNYNSYSGSVTIPLQVTYNGIPYSVTAIGGYAFRGCSNLTSVTIPNSVTSIGSSAFISSYGLTSVTIPNSVTEISSSAFAYCRGITSVSIGNSVTLIGGGAFSDCSLLKSVTIGNSVKEIGSGAFSGCTGLTSVTIPNSVTKIGSFVFQNCSGLTSVTFGNSVAEIGQQAFDDCSSLTSIVIPPSVTTLGYNVFYKCTGLKRSAYPDRFENPYKFYNSSYGTTTEYGTAIAYPSDGFIDEAGLIYNSDQSKLYFAPLTIKSVTIPNSVTEIGDYSFSYCSSLTSVTIPNSVTEIGNYTFSGCSLLKSVTIPNSITEIGNWTFRDCTSLTSVTLPNTLNTIGSGAFSGCTGLTAVALPNSLNTIGGSAFSNCTGLKSVVVPPLVTSCAGAFYNCTGLVRSAYPETIENPFKYYDGYYQKTTYYGTAIPYPVDAYFDEDGIIYSADQMKLYFAPLSLEEAVIPHTVTTIQSNAFSKCTELTSVVIPSSVSSIVGSPFFGCTGLIKSAYPDNLTKPFYNGVSIAYPSDGIIDNSGLIYNADKTTLYFAPLNIQSALIPNTVSSIHESAFLGCSSMIKGAYPNSLANPFISGVAITYPADGVIDEADNVFNADKTKLYYVSVEATSVVIPASVTSLDANALYACDNLIKSAYPESIDNPFTSGLAIAYPVDGVSDESGMIYNNDKSTLFYAPYTLESATIPEGVTTIGQDACNLCSSLTDVVIPNSVVLIKDRAFEGTPFLNNQPEGVVYLGKVLYTYKGEMPESTSIDIEDGTISINQNALKDCPNISAINIPATVTTIGESAFENCAGISKLALSNNITSLGDASFKGCSGLRLIDYNTAIVPADNAFADAGNHCRIIFGSNVTTINGATLKNMSNLSTVVVGSKVTAVSNGIEAINKPRKVASLETATSTKIIWLTSNTPENYSSITGKVNYVLNNKFTELSNTETYNSLGSMFEVDGIVYVLVSPAQRTCDVIDSNDLSLADNITIGNVEYRSINLSTKKVNQYAFNGCNTLKSVTLDESVTTIAAGAFSDCASLEQFTIPTNITTIGDKAFSGCTALTSVEIKDRDDDITMGTQIFDGTAVSSIYLGGNVNCSGSTAQESPLYNLTTLEQVEMSEKVTAVADNLFYGCSGIHQMIVPDAVKTIGCETFSGCSNLTEVIIGSSVETIGEHAFDGCESVILLSSFAVEPPVCAEGALDGINIWICTLMVLDTSMEKYQSAEQWCNFFRVSGANEVVDAADQLLIDGGVLHCGGVDTEVYTLSGVQVYSGCGDVELAAGTYIVVAQGRATKVVVK